jgi:hypothetical protein
VAEPCPVQNILQLASIAKEIVNDFLDRIGNFIQPILLGDEIGNCLRQGAHGFGTGKLGARFQR